MNIKEELNTFGLELKVLEDDLWVIRGRDEYIVAMIWYAPYETQAYIMDDDIGYLIRTVLSECIMIMSRYHE